MMLGENVVKPERVSATLPATSLNKPIRSVCISRFNEEVAYDGTALTEEEENLAGSATLVGGQAVAISDFRVKDIEEDIRALQLDSAEDNNGVVNLENAKLEEVEKSDKMDEEDNNGVVNPEDAKLEEVEKSDNFVVVGGIQ
ncbi:hypothetical protein L6164_005383 [Bauhinia variegata]|uniref:Uncharacterized protein n=1 Tax=Bauhinia variegata TaxID=167791 RepID=A0ACB9PQ50_BAUVA|nr:hypothetical protein L6164_005383 [Bauhinia variegata]